MNWREWKCSLVRHSRLLKIWTGQTREHWCLNNYDIYHVLQVFIYCTETVGANIHSLQYSLVLLHNWNWTSAKASGFNMNCNCWFDFLEIWATKSYVSTYYIEPTPGLPFTFGELRTLTWLSESGGFDFRCLEFLKDAINSCDRLGISNFKILILFTAQNRNVRCLVWELTNTH